jgi:hypothetical protein
MPSELRPTSTQTPISPSDKGPSNNGASVEIGSEFALGDIMPISSYEGEKGYPFAVEYYKLNTPYEFLDSEVREDIETIDSFVKQYINDEGKEDTVKSYQKTLDALQKKLGIEDSMLKNASLKKISTLVRNYQKVADAYQKNLRRKILNKLIKMSNEGHSQFDQTEYILEKMGGII